MDIRDREDKSEDRIKKTKTLGKTEKAQTVIPSSVSLEYLGAFSAKTSIKNKIMLDKYKFLFLKTDNILNYIKPTKKS